MLSYYKVILLLIFTIIWSTSSWTINHPVYPLPNSIPPVSNVSSYVAMSDVSLAALLDTNGGGPNTQNYAMKSILYKISTLYYSTLNTTYSNKAKVLLLAYADVIPSWPMTDYVDYNVKTNWSQVNWGAWNNGGFWGTWFHQDMEETVELVLSYDYIYNTLSSTDRTRIEGLLDYMVTMNLKNGDGVFDFSNMGGNDINGLVPFGRVFKPSLIHMVYKYLTVYPLAMYTRDGSWSEGTVSYHNQITNRLCGIGGAPYIVALTNYSDPVGYVDSVDGTTFVNVNYRGGSNKILFDRMYNSSSFWALPNHQYDAEHDSISNAINWYVPYSKTVSRCNYGSRECILGDNSNDDQYRVRLHFSGTEGHEHLDVLNLGIFAYNYEVMSEGEYKQFGNRDWAASSAGHNTVLVDGLNQKDRMVDQFQVGPNDYVDGLNYLYRYQDNGHGNTFNAGNLKMFHSLFPRVRVQEANGGRAIVTPTDIYERFISTVLTNSSNTLQFYTVDIFRISGGIYQDYMYHGNLVDQDLVELSVSTQPTSLDRYSNYVTITNLTTLSSSTNPTWSSKFKSPSNGSGYKTTHLTIDGSTLSIGTGPAMRRVGNATFIDVRHVGMDTIYCAIHEPFNNTFGNQIQSIEPINFTPTNPSSYVSFKVNLVGGRVDYIAHTLDQPPYPLRSIGSTGIKFQGRYAHVSVVDNVLSTAYLVEGSYLSTTSITGGVVLQPDTGVSDLSHRGTVVSFSRLFKGDSFDGLVAKVGDGVTLPIGTTLNGATLIVLAPDSRTEAFTISFITKVSTTTYNVITTDDPGFELRVNTNNTKIFKYTYYPNHGLPYVNPIQYIIPGYAYYSDGNTTTSTGQPIQPSNNDISNGHVISYSLVLILLCLIISI